MKFEVEIDPRIEAAIERFLRAAGNEPDGTHGPLTVEKLVMMLLEDVAAIGRWPTPWEASCMAEVLKAHGYGY